MNYRKITNNSDYNLFTLLRIVLHQCWPRVPFYPNLITFVSRTPSCKNSSFIYTSFLKIIYFFIIADSLICEVQDSFFSDLLIKVSRGGIRLVYSLRINIAIILCHHKEFKTRATLCDDQKSSTKWLNLFHMAEIDYRSIYFINRLLFMNAVV